MLIQSLEYISEYTKSSETVGLKIYTAYQQPWVNLCKPFPNEREFSVVQ